MSSDVHPKVLLRQLEQRARRRFGQHFLWRPDVVRRIVQAARVEAGDRVLEIGPGLGILTGELERTRAEVTAIELDRDLAGWIRTTYPEVALVEGDALAQDMEAICAGSGWKVVSNLPYNVGTLLVLRLIGHPGTFESLTVMLQKEVVDRILAEPGTKAYGALTVQIAARAERRLALRVPPGAFYPPPKVDSSVVHLALHPQPRTGPAGPVAFDAVVRAAFAQRRKMLRNTLGARYGRQEALRALEQVGIDPTRRAETLTLEAYRELAGALHPAAGDDAPRSP